MGPKTVKTTEKTGRKAEKAGEVAETSRAGKKKAAGTAKKTPGKRGGARSTTRAKGWGGPAKGAGGGKKANDFKGVPGPGRGKFSVAGEIRKDQTYRRTETLMELLWNIANEPREMTANRIRATESLLNRIQGLPVQTVIAANQDDLSMMTDEELAADVQSRARKIRALREAVMGPDVPDEPDGVGDRGVEPDGPGAGGAPPDPPR